jgi:hypothetical protein
MNLTLIYVHITAVSAALRKSLVTDKLGLQLTASLLKGGK